MKPKLLIALLALAAAACGLQAAAPEPDIQLGLQAYTFRDRTFAEALDRAVAMGIKYIQIYPNQKISPTNNTKTNQNMNAAARAEVLALAKAKGLTITSYGVYTARSETEWRQLFAFAKEMGLRDLCTQPNETDLPLLAKLSAETGITISIHNHPTPAHYANPQTVLDALAPYANNKNIGFCADTGHWARSGYDPVATLKKVEGHIISAHLKDISEFGVREAHDMPWGSGATKIALQIAELRRQGFKGIVYMEYEFKTPRIEAEAAASADWFHRAVAAPLDDLIAGRVPPANFVSVDNLSQIWSDKTRNAATGQWTSAKPLFAPDLSNATLKTGSWKYADGILASANDKTLGKGGAGNIWTKDTYGDFVLNLDFRCEEKTNSGILIRCADTANWLNTSMEIQILQGEEPNAAPNDKHLVGAIYDISAPARPVEIEPGKWYHLSITAKGQSIQVSIDGEQLNDVDLSKWTEAGKNPDGTPNKFKTAYAQMPLKGRIGLQYHGTPISFRNIVIERLDDAPASDASAKPSAKTDTDSTAKPKGKGGKKGKGK